VRRSLVPKSVRNRIKEFWSMKQRPQLSNTSIERLTSIFDADLATLGQWLSLDLNCENFKQAASETSPSWTCNARATVA